MSRYVTTAGEQMAELAARSTDAGRLSRGRALFRKGAVSDLSVIEGTVIASVLGSGGDVYETTVGTALAPAGVTRQVIQAQDLDDKPTVDDLIADGVSVCPRDIDLAFGCDCPDWDEPCKHVVAVLLAFADRVDLDEAELLRWRGIGLSPGSGVDDKPHDRTTTLSELEALLGDTVMRVPTTDGSGEGPPAQALDPALAEFLGVGMIIEPMDPIDAEGIGPPAPLFATFQLGPLAELGPELADAMAIIVDQLESFHRVQQ